MATDVAPGGWRSESAKGWAQHKAAAPDWRPVAPITIDIGGARGRTPTAHPNAATSYCTPQGRWRSRHDSTLLRGRRRAAVRLRLNLRPAWARRLSKAGRHSAPIARQRATRKARHSGLTWPTYCNKPKGAPPFMDGMGRTAPDGGSRCPPKKDQLGLRFFEWLATGRAGAPA
jgi:hypothetical protein